MNISNYVDEVKYKRNIPLRLAKKLAAIVEQPIEIDTSELSSCNIGDSTLYTFRQWNSPIEFLFNTDNKTFEVTSVSVRLTNSREIPTTIEIKEDLDDYVVSRC